MIIRNTHKVDIPLPSLNSVNMKVFVYMLCEDSFVVAMKSPESVDFCRAAATPKRRFPRLQIAYVVEH